MSDSIFKTVLIKDPRLQIQSEYVMGVESGANQVTYQQFEAISTSSTSITFNLQVPSESIVISRDILIQSTVTFQLNITNVPDTQYAFIYGTTDAYQSFPLSKLMTTVSATINNTNVSVNLQDLIDPLLRMNDSRHLYKYHSTTPSLPDQSYLTYNTGYNATNNPLGSYNTASYDVDQVPRGSFAIDNFICKRTTAAGVTTDNIVSTADTDTFVVTITATFVEPLFLSPFIFANPKYNNQGLMGINNMNLVYNIHQSGKRFFSCMTNYGTNTRQITSTSLVNAPGTPSPFGTTKLLVNFLTLQNSDAANISTRNVVPYLDMPRFVSNTSSSKPFTSVGARNTITSQNIQLNQIPDLFMIFCRIPMNKQTVTDAASFLTINGISCNLNNASGLLSSATQYDLWRISQRNGLNMSFNEFKGVCNNTNETTGAATLNYYQTIYTTGSVLVLAPAYDLSLPEYISCSSLGQYNFQFNLDVTNYYTATVANPVLPELVVVTVNSGVFVTQQGTSSTYTGLLTKEKVLATLEDKSVSPINKGLYEHMVGGNIQNRIKSGIKSMLPHSHKHSHSHGGSSGGNLSGGESGGSHHGIHQPTGKTQKLKKHLLHH